MGVTESGDHDDPSSVVIVPSRPGPLESLGGSERNRDEVDELLDDMFGEPDERGPGVADAVLVVGGAGAVVGGLAASLPGVVLVGGAVAVALGIVLPVRSGWRRLTANRRQAQLAARLAGGIPMRIDHEAVAELVAAHVRLTEAAHDANTSERSRLQSIAHAAVYEVASLLGGQRPQSPAELEYVQTRTRALGELVDVVVEVGLANGDPIARQARIEARRDVKDHGGSSLTDAAGLIEELRRAQF